MIDLASAPFPITYRELWLPGAIKDNAILSRSRYDGHDLALTGARKGSTVDGCRFRGGATDNLVIGAHGDQQNKAAFHVTIRFRFPAGYAAGDGDVYLFNWDNGGFDYIRLWFATADGKIYFEQGDAAAGNEFQLVGTLTTWVAGQFYEITARLQDTPEQELYEDGVSVASSTVATPIDTPAGGDIIVGSSADGGADGAKVDISFVLIGVGATAVVAIDDTEAANLAKGLPPATAKVQYFFPMDEGRGVTVTNRGNATGNGTLDTGVSWAFGQVQQPALSLDKLNDYARTGANVVDIGGNITVFWVGKLKSTYDGTATNNSLLTLYQSAIDLIGLSHPSGIVGVRWRVRAQATDGIVNFLTAPLIDQYFVYIGTLTIGGITEFFVNGLSAGKALGVPTFTAPALADARLGCWGIGAELDISKPLCAGLIEGAFTQERARAYSRWLKNIFNLPISI